jgi:NADH-quinone oxidoreductase subunit E
LNPTETQAPPVAKKASLAERHAARIEAIASKYPTRRSGVMDLLWLVQEEEGWISTDAMEEIAAICGIQPCEVVEMVSFYTMYNTAPVGKFVFQVCGTLPCAVCGADGLLDYLTEKLGVGVGETTEDGLFTIKKVECLGACSEAPLMLVNKRMALRLTRAKADEIIKRCRLGDGE